MPPASPEPTHRAGGAAARRQSDVRDHNLALVLELVHRHGAVSRADLTRTSGLNRSTIAGLVGELSARGLLEQAPAAGAGGPGRPSHVVRPRPDGPWAVAVEVDVGRLVVARVGLGGAVLSRSESELAPSADPAPAVRAVAREVRGLAGRSRCPGPAGVGVSVPGTVRRSDGLVRSAPNLGWVDVDVPGLLARALRATLPGVPVRVGNDADLGARAEHLRGAGRGVADLVYLLGNVGIGAGIVAGGRLLPGATGLTGELGHTVLQLDGPSCRCGGTGCFETLVGTAALAAAAGDPDPGDPAAADRVLAAARAGRPGAVAAVRLVARRLGAGLATVTHLLDPQVVVLAGLLEQLWRLAPEDVCGGLARQLGPARTERADIRLPELGADGVLLGAAELAFDELFSSSVGLRLPAVPDRR